LNLRCHSHPLNGLDVAEVIALLERAFPFGSHAFEVKNAFFGGDTSGSPIQSISVRDNKALVGVAFARLVEINIGHHTIPAITVGPLAVLPKAQGKGVGALLLRGVDELAAKEGADAVYLQGIPRFYKRFGYVVMMPKSKMVITTSSLELQVAEINIRPANYGDARELSDIYTQLADNVSGAARRGQEVWNWLLGPASRSWYFQTPRVIESKYGTVGYFCVDRGEKHRVREVAYKPDRESIATTLAALDRFAQSNRLNEFEVMTWNKSPLHCQASFKCTMRFIESSSYSGGQLVKFMRAPATIEKVLDKGVAGERSTLEIRELDDSYELRIGPDTVMADKDALGLWLFGALDFWALLARGDIRCSSVARLPMLAEALNVNGSKHFVFQGDNL
jgi:predicted N-acetyltransferase YhbS